MKNQKYDRGRPLARLEKGDKAIIKVRRIYISDENIPQKDRKYINIPDGIYVAEYMGDYKLKCEEQPLLSGKYCYWHGNKWGTRYGIYADELKNH